jgi:LuxR family quorum-sensing system transcriptional regulator ExpR|uniref:helix-turn-helix transcriptional regulator n=1 Tax=Scandinavium goeteborgense TaxID=1851514 RepID=UPI00135714CB|nr:LuxR family transcriptional regulator [Scandinavium goeteborgense]
MKSYFSDSEKNKHIKESIEKGIAKYGKINYAYAVMDKKNTDNILIINDISDDFANTYLENKYQNIDPVVINALNRITSFVWDDSLKINSYWPMEKVFILKSYSFLCGHTFVLHDHYNNMAMLTLYFDKFLMADVGELIKTHKNDFQGILLDTHEMLLQVYRRSEDMSAARTALSTREAEILYWCCAGKTYTEVAGILQLTTSTIKFHMGKVVKKLGVKNAKHAISVANELNIIPRPGK